MVRVETQRVLGYHGHFRRNVASAVWILDRIARRVGQYVPVEFAGAGIERHGGKLGVLGQQVDLTLIVHISGAEIDAGQIHGLGRLAVIAGAGHRLLRYRDGLVVAQRHAAARVKTHHAALRADARDTCRGHHCKQYGASVFCHKDIILLWNLSELSIL